MFESCNTLAELNATRMKLIDSVDTVTLNNAYNVRRTEILNTKPMFTKPNFITIIPAPAQTFAGIPCAGKSTVAGCIQFKPGVGFFY